MSWTSNFANTSTNGENKGQRRRKSSNFYLQGTHWKSLLYKSQYALNLNIFIGILCEHSNPAVEQIGIDQCLLACFAVCRAVENGGGGGQEGRQSILHFCRNRSKTFSLKNLGLLIDPLPIPPHHFGFSNPLTALLCSC